ncbi:Transcriptional protein SWT1 [Toxocara canis]|uniref:Transcriptional protein SWT1 n=1 Tax=Toxocara canis TaxID=6265 RepID=A0A0B2VXN5_TOXCA|nr:Transcriptional protein SWT1 [Toxocara canis]
MQMAEFMEVDERNPNMSETTNGTGSSSSSALKPIVSILEETEEPMDIGDSEAVHREKDSCFGEGHMASPFKEDSLVVVFDTSVLLESPDVIMKCVDAANYVVIPYKVIEELDNMKKQDCGKNSIRATEANSILYDISKRKNEFIIFESCFQCNDRLEGLRCFSNDDYVLKCALDHFTKYAHSVEVVLATEDKNLSLKAAASHLETITTRELIGLIEISKGEIRQQRGREVSVRTNFAKNSDEEHKDIHTKNGPESLPSFNFALNLTMQAPNALTCLDGALKTMQSVCTFRRLEPKPSARMQEFLHYCELIVAKICSKRSKSAADKTTQTHISALLSSIANVRQCKIGSVSNLVELITSLAPQYLDEEVLFEKKHIETEYPDVWRQATRRFSHLQTQLM